MSPHFVFGQRILVLGAHADDAELAMGGTIARMTEQGCEVQVVVYALAAPPRPVTVRLGEAQRGAARLGASLTVCSQEERQVEDVPLSTLVRDIDQLLSQFQPETVFTHFPGDPHQDHRLLASAMCSCLRKSPCSLVFMEPNALRALPLPQFEPNCYVDITPVASKKWEAIQEHTSQKNVLQDLESYKQQARYHGVKSGNALAEAFFIARFSL